MKKARKDKSLRAFFFVKNANGYFSRWNEMKAKPISEMTAAAIM